MAVNGPAVEAEILSPPRSFWCRSGPALTLMVLSPLVAEVLPGATRFSSIFVLPIEICVWGGGALLIREVIRRRRLGWRNMLCLALALAVAEECLIQQTSLAPMVLQIKGDGYARAMGVNYVYLLWALVYEPVFVVFVPISLVELIFPDRRDESWIGRAGIIAVCVLFLLGAFLAWFSWTQIARPQVFHVPAYNPPPVAVGVAVGVIALLLTAGTGSWSRPLDAASQPRTPPSPWVPGTLAAACAILWYGLVLLAFGIAPGFPPVIAVGLGISLIIATLLWLPRRTAHPEWGSQHQFALLFGTMLGSMLVGFVGFIGAATSDVVFKALADLMALGLLIVLGRKVRHRDETRAS